MKLGEPCRTCGRNEPNMVRYYCDEDTGEPWCGDCFALTPCGKGDHGEGCETMVFGD